MRLVITLVFLLSAELSAAQSLVSDPPLPASEHLVYNERIGSDLHTVEQRLRLKSENGRSFYEVTSVSPAADILLRLDKDTLFSFYSEVTSRTKDSVIRRTNQILQNSYVPKPDELVVSDFNSLTLTLQGFPWGRVSFARLVSLGAANAGESFQFELNVQGQENLSVNGKSYSCWKVQMGLAGLYGALLGKTYLWYNAQSPHYLVRSVGPISGPGSPLRTIELVSYNSGD